MTVLPAWARVLPPSLALGRAPSSVGAPPAELPAWAQQIPGAWSASGETREWILTTAVAVRQGPYDTACEPNGMGGAGETIRRASFPTLEEVLAAARAVMSAFQAIDSAVWWKIWVQERSSAEGDPAFLKAVWLHDNCPNGWRDP